MRRIHFSQEELNLLKSSFKNVNVIAIIITDPNILNIEVCSRYDDEQSVIVYIQKIESFKTNTGIAFKVKSIDRDRGEDYHGILNFEEEDLQKAIKLIHKELGE